MDSILLYSINNSNVLCREIILRGFFMSLQLILGSAGSGKSYQMYEDVITRSKENPDTEHLIIVPEQFTLQTQKDMVNMHPDHGVMNVDILSFLRFAYRIFDETAASNYPILEDTGKSMVIRKVVADKKKDLILFGSNVKKNGFINELKSFLSELYQYNIVPEDFERLMKASENKTILKTKLADVLTIYEAFKDFMKERYITAEEVLILLNNVMDQSQWLKNSVIYLDGFTGFTPSQYQILRKMIMYAKKVIVTVTIDPRESLELGDNHHQLFAISKKTIGKLYGIAKEVNTRIEEPRYAEEITESPVPYRFKNCQALVSLEANLFRYPYMPYYEEQDEIKIYSTKDAEEEMLFVAGQIEKLVSCGQYRYRDIAVVTGDIEAYNTFARGIFTRAKIPCFIDYKKKILGNPFAEFLRSAIAIVEEDYSYESVFRYLRTGLSDITREDIDLFNNYVMATGVRGNKRYQEPFKRIYRSKDEIDLQGINRVREQLVDEIGPLYKVLKDKDKDVKDYTRALYELGVRLDVEEKLLGFCNNFQEDNMSSLAKEYEQIYGIVMDLYDQIVLLLGSEHIRLKEFSEIIETGLTEAKVGLIPPGVDELVIGDIQRTRLKDVKVLFFVGINEGLVPGAFAGGGILSDSERELLVSHDIELAPTRRQEAFTEQFYIYLSMTKPSDKLYITFHRVNDEGKSVNPSFIISKVQALFPKLEITYVDSSNEDLESVFMDKGVSYLAKGLSLYQDGNHDGKVNDLWRELFNYYRSHEETESILDKLIDGTFYINKEEGISKEIANLLYGDELRGSVTRLERYAGCAFAHFMAYGLSLEERQEYKLAVPDIGNIFHNAIDDFSKRLSSGQYTWHTIPDETRDQWAVESVNKAVEEYENSFIRSTKRNEYMIKRIERITIRTLWALCSQIKQGVFEPSGYEMAFYHLPDKSISLRGRIDRMDLYEDDDKVYVRVIDYKSGSTSFDIQRVYYGLQQQLGVYLSAAMDYLHKQHGDKEIVPAGIFYYHIDDPLVAKSDQTEEEIFKSLKMNGLVNKDKEVVAMMDENLKGPDGSLRSSVSSNIIQAGTNKDGELNKRSSAASKKQIEALGDYINGKLVKDGKKILEGDTKVNPYRMGNRTACDYCQYKSVCGFDLRLPGYGYRNLEKKPVDEIKNEIWGEEAGD